MIPTQVENVPNKTIRQATKRTPTYRLHKRVRKGKSGLLETWVGNGESGVDSSCIPWRAPRIRSISYTGLTRFNDLWRSRGQPHLQKGMQLLLYEIHYLAWGNDALPEEIVIVTNLHNALRPDCHLMEVDHDRSWKAPRWCQALGHIKVTMSRQNVAHDPMTEACAGPWGGRDKLET